MEEEEGEGKVEEEEEKAASRDVGGRRKSEAWKGNRRQLHGSAKDLLVNVVGAAVQLKR